MSLGQITTIVTCVSGNGPQGPCPNSMQVQYVDAYILAPSSESSINSLNTTFDPYIAAQYYSISFTTVLGLWVFSKCIGSILRMLKKR